MIVGEDGTVSHIGGNRIGGVILCGGRSRRMGTPKAWLPIGTETLLGRTVRVVSAVVSPIVVVAAADQEVPPLPLGIPILRDEIADCGPLGGLVSGMAALEGRVDAVFLAACDLPFLTEAFVRELIAAHSPSVAITAPETNGQRHPLAAVYALSLLPSLRERLHDGQLRMMDLLESVTTRCLPVDAHPLQNVNTPEEYAALENTPLGRLPGSGS